MDLQLEVAKCPWTREEKNWVAELHRGGRWEAVQRRISTDKRLLKEEANERRGASVVEVTQ